MAKKEENTVEKVEQAAPEAVKPAEENEQTIVSDEQNTEKNEQNAVDGEQTTENVNIEQVEVPENAEEITEGEALALAADEVNRLREENTALKQALDDKTNELNAVVAKTNEEAGIAGKQILDLEAKVKETEEKLAASLKGGNNATYIELLETFEAKIDEYAGMRRERLRKEFITDLKEEIQRQKDLLKNA